MYATALWTLLTLVSAQDLGYQAGLIIDGATFCSGALLNNFVITTATCIKDAFEVDVVLGVDNLAQPTKTAFISTEFYIPDDFKLGDFDWNVGIIKIPNLNPAKYQLKNVKLPTTDTDSNNAFQLCGFNLENSNLGCHEMEMDIKQCQDSRLEAKDFVFANNGSVLTQGDVLCGITVSANHSTFCAVNIYPFLDWIHSVVGY